ncbi:uncharacterized protein V6R79_001872 [Siganus canaliculatus]
MAQSGPKRINMDFNSSTSNRSMCELTSSAAVVEFTELYTLSSVISTVPPCFHTTPGVPSSLRPSQRGWKKMDLGDNYSPRKRFPAKTSVLAPNKPVMFLSLALPVDYGRLLENSSGRRSLQRCTRQQLTCFPVPHLGLPTSPTPTLRLVVIVSPPTQPGEEGK